MGLTGNLDIGTLGSDDFTDTNAHVSGSFGANGAWYAIQAINGDAVFTECTMVAGEAKDGVTLDSGQWLFGLCTKITLSSGSVRAYRTIMKID